MIELGLDGIENTTIRDNFVSILEEFKSPLLNFKFKFFELTFTGAVTNYRYLHNMGFIPKDIIQTSKTGAGAITFNYSLFSNTHLDITTSGACVVRFLAGNFSPSSNA